MSVQRGRHVSLPHSLVEAENNEQILRGLYGQVAIRGFFHNFTHLRFCYERYMI